ncbi:MAG: acetyltransferase [Candidatus Krumholzibacteriota bacterium]|nr:acetyltransferase [Candidatus Krumholzibacteriota bacterium]
MKDLVIYGAGGFAREVAFLVDDINSASGLPVYRLVGYISDAPGDIGGRVGAYSVVGDLKWLQKGGRRLCCVFAIGTPSVVKRLSDHLAGKDGLEYPNLVHPSVVWNKDLITIGRGNIITAGSILMPDVTVGSFNIFNLKSSFGHDVKVGDCCVINPGSNISGNVSIGDRVLVGTGATILQGLSIGDEAVVGAGALVTKDVREGTTVFGVPARRIM